MTIEEMILSPNSLGGALAPHPNFRAFCFFNKEQILPLLEEGDTVEDAVLAAMARLEGKGVSFPEFRFSVKKPKEEPKQRPMFIKNKPGRATVNEKFATDFRDSGLSPEKWLETEMGKKSGLTLKTLHSACCKYIKDGNRLWCVRNGTLPKAQRDAEAKAKVKEFLDSGLSIADYCDGRNIQKAGFVVLLRRHNVSEEILLERGYKPQRKAEVEVPEIVEDENLQQSIEAEEMGTTLDGYEFPEPEPEEEAEGKTVADRCNDLASKEIELLGEKARKFDLIKELILKREGILDQLKEVDEEIRQLL